MSRLKAAAIHLAISLTLATTIGAILQVLFIFTTYFVAAGASRLMITLIGLDFAIFLLVTLFAANPNKPERLLNLDLSIIAVLQASGLGYGIRVISNRQGKSPAPLSDVSTDTPPAR